MPLFWLVPRVPPHFFEKNGKMFKKREIKMFFCKKNFYSKLANFSTLKKIGLAGPRPLAASRSLQVGQPAEFVEGRAATPGCR